MDSITVPRSVFVNGQWATAHWMADVVDESTSELVITATLAGEGGQGPVVTALRMDMDLARRLRTMAMEQTSEPGCYDCRTTGERLAVQEDRLQTLSDTMRRIVAEIDQRLDALEAAAAPAIANREWMREIESRLDDLVLRAVSETTHVALMKRVDALETKNASATVHLNQVPNAVHSIDQLTQRIAMLEKLNLATRIAYLERCAQGITGPDAGL